MLSARLFTQYIPTMAKLNIAKTILIIMVVLCGTMILHNSYLKRNMNGELSFDETNLFDADMLLSHPLENSCKYPILDPQDPTLSKFFKHPRKMVCGKVQYEFTSLYDNGYLYVHEDVTLPKYRQPLCYYRPFDGTLKPRLTNVQWTDKWKELKVGSNKILDDQFAVKCFNTSKRWNKEKTTDEEGLPDDVKAKQIYHYSYAQLIDQKKQFKKSSDVKLNLDLLVIDSTSLNNFRRHMPHTWPYMKDVMKFEWFEGYNKVADNSMVNLMPVLAGLRYGNQSADFPSEINPETYKTSVLELEPIDFVWNKMKENGCVTMLNDDVGAVSRGLFHYPAKQARGWKIKPVDYYFRPWHVYNYRYLITKKSHQCIKNHPYHEEVLRLTENYMSKFAETWHFSFTFLTDLTHNSPINIEAIDDYLYAMLNRLYMNNRLNNTAFIIMGDHGNRISNIKRTFVGKFEERLPLFALYLPEWLKKQNPDLMRNLRINRQRLTSNYDVWQTIKEIASGSWKKSKLKHKGKGLSVLRPIPHTRTCEEANIPEQYCTCLVNEESAELLSDHNEKVEKTLVDWIQNNVPCYSESWTLTTVEVEMVTMNQMVAHGIRIQNATSLKKLEEKFPVDIYYFEITTIITLPNTVLKVKARFRYDVNENLYSMNVHPLILEGLPKNCQWAKTLEEYCSCLLS